MIQSEYDALHDRLLHYAQTISSRYWGKGVLDYAEHAVDKAVDRFIDDGVIEEEVGKRIIRSYLRNASRHRDSVIRELSQSEKRELDGGDGFHILEVQR
jgi:hypothetical protein